MCCKCEEDNDFIQVDLIWEMECWRNLETSDLSSLSSWFRLDLLRCHLRRVILCEGGMLTNGNILKREIIAKREIIEISSKITFCILMIMHIWLLYILTIQITTFVSIFTTIRNFKPQNYWMVCNCGWEACIGLIFHETINNEDLSD